MADQVQLDQAAIDAAIREVQPYIDGLFARLGVRGIGPDGKLRATLLAISDRLIAHDLEQRSLAEGPKHECPKCGALARRKQRRKRHILTACGRVEFMRSEYQCDCGNRFVPLDDELGLEEGSECTAALRELISYVAAEEPLEATSKTLEKLLGFSLPSSVVDRAAQIEGARAEHMLDDKAEQEADASGKTLLVEIDGCQIAHRDGWHETKCGVVTDNESRVVKPPSAGEIERAALAGREPKGREMLINKAYLADARSLESFKHRLWRECERQGLLSASRIVLVGDGAKWIWNLGDDLFRIPGEQGKGQEAPEYIPIVDWYHAMEHVWDAAELIYGTRKSKAAREWVRRWEARLWEDGAASAFAKTLRRRAKELKGERKKDLLTEAGYFEGNSERMKYPEYREAGLPVGSGPAEGVCKNVVQARCKRAGMRWKPDGLSRILSLRTHRLNDRWGELWPLAA